MRHLGRLLTITLLFGGLPSGCDDTGSAEPGPPDASPHDTGLDAAHDMAPGDIGPADAATSDAGADAEQPDQMLPPDALVPPPGPDGTVPVYVTLDDAPAVGAVITQGGTGELHPVDDQGWAHLPVDLEVEGDLGVVASHPEARQRAADLEEGGPTVISLTRFSARDNPDYLYQDPGAPGRRDTTAQCGHCHLTLNDDWYASAHRQAASNPVVHDLYAGTAARFADAGSCAEAGGRWQEGRLPGGGKGGRCYLGVGYLPLANPACGDGPCPEPEDNGGCADCHAPGINGAIGGRDLLEAEGRAYEGGVFCDGCHRVESVDLDAEGPGVSGRLRVLRPSERGPFTLGAGGSLPLTFGPSHDSPNPRMGSVQRDHYRNGELCGGCHQLDVTPLGALPALDVERWPDGKLPVQSTWAEWRDGPLAEAAACPDCHMPPAPMVANGADLQAFPLADTGVQGGWLRPPGAVRHHQWLGPRSADKGLLESAASLHIELRAGEDAVEAHVTTRNVGAGHRLPTGEPMRALLLRVEAQCGGAPLAPIGGDALPSWAGARGHLQLEEAADMPATLAAWPAGWPAPRVGDQVRVVRRTGAYHDYDGFGPFGDQLPPEAKGISVEHVGERVEVIGLEAEAPVFDVDPLPEGHVAYLVSEDTPDALAGASGFAFARVMAGADGDLMVPHFAATDVVSDNRLAPQQAWTSTHTFPGGCPDLVVRATLLHRAHPWALARARGWAPSDQIMATARATLQSPAFVPSTPPAEGEVISVDLRAAPTADGGYAYNGELPIIRARVGDTLEARLDNALEVPTTIHWHGVKVPFEMDGVTWMSQPVAPGAQFDYRFPLTHPGTFWFHPHFDTEGQVDRGLYGALLVDPAGLPAPGPEAYDEVVWVFDAESEARPAGADGDRSAPGHAHGHGRLRTPWRVNGAPTPVEYTAPDRPVRVRVINASNAAYLALRWPEMRHIEGQQGFLPSLQQPTQVIIPPGGREGFEWLVGAPFTVEALPYTLNGGEALGEPTPLAHVSPARPGLPPAPWPWPFTGETPTADPGQADVVYAFAGSDRSGQWLINGERFPDVTPFEATVGQILIADVYNVSPTEHPFHLHGLHFEVIAVDGVPVESAWWADTVSVGINARLRLRIPIDNAGDWMTHCHILPHAEDGMMTILRAQE